jgi:hypothetical protein
MTVLTATNRLALSRARMRQAMRDVSAPRHEGTAKGVAGAFMPWLDHLKSIPGARVVIDAVSSWWVQHPLRIAGMLGAEAAKAVARPMAQRHPFSLVLGATLLGGLFAWSRPWRWIAKPALFAGLMPQLFTKAMANVPVQSWMAVVTSLLQEQSRPQRPAQPTEPTHHEQLTPAHSSAS